MKLWILLLYWLIVLLFWWLGRNDDDDDCVVVDVDRIASRSIFHRPLAILDFLLVSFCITIRSSSFERSVHEGIVGVIVILSYNFWAYMTVTIATASIVSVNSCHWFSLSYRISFNRQLSSNKILSYRFGYANCSQFGWHPQFAFFIQLKYIYIYKPFK